jgi:hypothetical protein
MRSISYASDGIPLTTREHGWELADKEEPTVKLRRRRVRKESKKERKKTGAPLHFRVFQLS